MKKIAIAPLILSFLFYFNLYAQNMKDSHASTAIKSPVALKKPFEIVSANGHKRTDPYYWMKHREDARVIQYLQDENKYLDDVMGHTKSLQEKIFAEMKNRIKEDDSSVPYKRDNYYYYTRVVAGGEYPVYCRKKDSLAAAEEIIMDGNELGKGKAFLNFTIHVSPDHHLACVSMDTVGRNFFNIQIKNTGTGEWLSDLIPSTRGNIEWLNNNRSFLYSVPDPETLRQHKVMMHTIGKAAESDELIYEEKDATLECELDKSKSKKYIFIYSARTDADFVQFIDADKPGRPVVIRPLEKEVEYNVFHAGGNSFFLLTNLNAKNYRLIQTPIPDTSDKNWKDIIPGRENVLLRNVDFFTEYIVAHEMSDGLDKLRIINRNDLKDFSITFDEAAYSAALGFTPEVQSPVFRFTYNSFITPPSTYDFNLKTHERLLMKQQEVPGGFNKELYTIERIMVPARDGEKIPFSMVYRKDRFKKDGSNAGWIYGYGSYGINISPSFNSNRISLLDRGFVFSIAHIRGGKDMGGEWYENGRMMLKKNTFYDFIDCSEWMIKNNYVAKNKLFASGGSAGGLLMGAVSNMRPDLYRGIVAVVPFVDVVTTMMDESIPLTTFEWNEWGNPAIPEQYDYMISYSPYDNVEKKNYPNLLVLTGLHDSQVQYWEPAKWVAKLRELKTDKNLLLLHTDMSAGHGGASGRFKVLKDVALQYAFALDILGIKE